MKMGKSNVQTLKIAQKYLGQGGSRFRKFCGLPSGSAWCNAFVDYVANESGNAPLFFNGQRMTYCPTSMKWCYNNLAQIPIYLALPMDIIYFDWEPNGVPNHIGFVRERKSDQEVYTIEGNTSGGIVAQKTRVEKYVCACFRPHFKPSGFDPSKPLAVDSYFGYNSIAVMQVWLKNCGCYTGAIDAIMGKGTIKGLQKKLGVSQDGSWGKGTSKALQKLIKTDVDGEFGANSVKAFQTYLNKAVFSATKSNGQKIADKAIELAYAGSPAEAKYPSGHPKPAYKSALEKVFPSRSKWSEAPRKGASCDVFVGTVVRASGVDTAFPRGLEYQLKHLEATDKFTCVLDVKRNVKKSELKDGDIITYLYKKGGGHIMIYAGGKARHASIKKWYGRTTSIDSRLKIADRKWIRVYRAR